MSVGPTNRNLASLKSFLNSEEDGEVVYLNPTGDTYTFIRENSVLSVRMPDGTFNSDESFITFFSNLRIIS